MSNRFQNHLDKYLSNKDSKRRCSNSDVFKDLKKLTHDAPKPKQRDFIPTIEIKKSYRANDLAFRYDKRKRLTLGCQYEIWARDGTHFIGICVWKDCKRDGAEFHLSNGSFKAIILSKTTYLKAKD